MRRLFLILSLCSFPLGFCFGFLTCYYFFKVKAPCTCAPCYPQKFCIKCGHRSLECPRLRWYFNSSNYLNKVHSRGD